MPSKKKKTTKPKPPATTTKKSNNNNNNKFFTTSSSLLFIGLSLILVLWLFLSSSQYFEIDDSSDTTGTGGGDNKGEEESASSSFVIGGYLPDYRSYIDVNATSTHLTDLILFSIQPTLDNKNKCCLSFHHYETAKKAKAYKSETTSSSNSSNDLKIWITIGGGGRTDALPQILSDETKRLELIEYIYNLCQKHSIEGIDWNFYHPQLIKLNLLMAFLQDATKIFQGGRFKISLALPHNEILPVQYYQMIYRINLMTYDMITTSQEKDNYHASLANTQKAVQMLIKSGCPRSKIILGIPAYGRNIINPGIVKTFAEIYDDFNFSSSTHQSKEEEWKSKIQSTQFDNNNNNMAWESPNLIIEKVNYARKEKLGGIFIWELGQDKQLELNNRDDSNFGYGGILLQSAANAVVASSSSTRTKKGSTENESTTTTTTSTSKSSSSGSNNDNNDEL